MMEVQKLYSHCILKGDAEYETGLGKFRAEMKLLGIDIKDYPEHKMMLLDYSQIDCIKKDHPIVMECRGLIMGYDGTIICRPFKRFFNIGECGIDTFDFETSIAFEKCDGSLVKIYFCPANNQWEIGTRGTAFAEGNNDFFPSFRHAILDAIGVTEEQFLIDCSCFDKNVTRLYEYISPKNRIVTPYEKAELVALSYIDNRFGDEIVAPSASIEIYSLKWNVREVEKYYFKTQENCLDAINSLSGLKEGFVCYSTITKQRIKIKSAVYVAVHRLRGNGLTTNTVCELVAMNEVDEYLAVFESDREKFTPALQKMLEIEHNLKKNYTTHMEIEDQKDFAIAIKDLPYSAVMFKARKDKCDVIHAFNSFPVSKRADWLKDELYR